MESVYNAEIERIDGNLTVTNPDEALVLSSYYSTVIDRKIQIVEGLLQFCDGTQFGSRSKYVLGPDPQRERSVSDDGRRERRPPVASRLSRARSGMPTGETSTSSLACGTTVDTSPRWQLSTYIPWDYRIDVPSDYSESGSCTIGNNTYSLTLRWGLPLLDSDAEVVNVTAGNISPALRSPGNVDDGPARLRVGSAGEVRPTATLRIETEPEHTTACRAPAVRSGLHPDHQPNGRTPVHRPYRDGQQR
ncbi:hypothetical protein [Haloplanus litoreus]|uniref:Uncharacterized protein n=1 Tax=Haloplanus litoreus TaxID=767515 RepID=A0ABD6A4E9_9EURY